MNKFGKKAILVAMAFFFCLPFSLIHASGNTGQDIYITIHKTYAEQYAYSVDILFRNTAYTYKILSIAENTETGERYINSGVWLEETGAETDGFLVSVLNRSDIPVRVDTVFDAGDFSDCGADIAYRAEGESILPAVLITDDGATPFGCSTLAKFGLYPEITGYSGEKHISATVCIRADSGKRSNGKPFNP